MKKVQTDRGFQLWKLRYRDTIIQWWKFRQNDIMTSMKKTQTWWLQWRNMRYRDKWLQWRKLRYRHHNVFQTHLSPLNWSLICNIIYYIFFPTLFILAVHCLPTNVVFLLFVKAYQSKPLYSVLNTIKCLDIIHSLSCCLFIKSKHWKFTRNIKWILIISLIYIKLSKYYI